MIQQLKYAEPILLYNKENFEKLGSAHELTNVIKETNQNSQ